MLSRGNMTGLVSGAMANENNANGAYNYINRDITL